MLCFQCLFKDVHEKHRHPKACGRSSIRHQKLPKEAQPHKAGYDRSDLKCKKAYTAYSNPRGFIYQNKDKQNRRSDKERAAAMIQGIDKHLKTKRIMRSLEKFVGGRLYEGDSRMLQRTI
nr:hypothetical protein [Tanacetum cinerariifolium]